MRVQLFVAVAVAASCQQAVTDPPSACELVQHQLAAVRRSVHRPRAETPSPTALHRQAPGDPELTSEQAEHTMNERFRSPAGYPLPASDEPKAYAAWLHALPRADRRRVETYCAANPVSYRKVCGGIGGMHIPYPPFEVRVFRTRPGDPRSWFASWHDWKRALTGSQRRFYERECLHGEDSPSNDLCGDNTPLVVVFGAEPVRFTAGGTFAFVPGTPDETDWPTPATPWLALDRDGDGAITSGAELFGSATVLGAGATAANGFEALAELDVNHDGQLDARDPAFASLLLWSDRDGDQHSSPGELAPAHVHVLRISLEAHRVPRCDARRNCEGERAAITWRDATGDHDGSIVDVYLPRR